ncbi:hypothetical protein QC763_117685 [Podospora pseudopauciseta]|uniref:Ecp2 effector protein domain-containing protein n=2 Tax=Podospora TaxID=5144 RepID=A0ABR0I1Y0_9PEZI|nr:hypothetical protein QC763_117685 [Podospora pseudopauciseta]KAK4682619.1 hypothetical protein QC764_117685 [Podospora pseudoanserina]
MFTVTTLTKLSLALLTASSTMVASLPPSNKPTLHRRVCYEGETTNLYCYTEEHGGIPQEVSEDDIKYVASYLRSYGRQVRAGRLLTMGPAELGTCDEWTLYQRGSVMVTAKHLNDTANSAVLFEDVATTIDGGVGATDAQKAKAIIGCLSDGGSLGVMVNRTNPMYNSTAYVSNRYTPTGIVIKVVSSGQ